MHIYLCISTSCTYVIMSHKILHKSPHGDSSQTLGQQKWTKAWFQVQATAWISNYCMKRESVFVVKAPRFFRGKKEAKKGRIKPPGRWLWVGGDSSFSPKSLKHPDASCHLSFSMTSFSLLASLGPTPLLALHLSLGFPSEVLYVFIRDTDLIHS